MPFNLAAEVCLEQMYVYISKDKYMYNNQSILKDK